MSFFSRFVRREAAIPAAHGPAPRFRSVARSHVGRVRKLNEDRFVEMPEAGLWAIADGMGGHRAGDVAAQMVADAVRQAVSDSSGKPISAEAVALAVHRVNGDLLQISRLRGGRDISGSTMVALIAHEDSYQCLWAGDSRAYLFRGGRCSRINRDHSVVQDLVDAGLVAPAAAAYHPQAHVVTRAVGVASALSLDFSDGELVSRDVILICSDGLSDVLGASEIQACIGQPTLEAMADALLAAALDAGAPDNVTFILIQAL